MASALSIALSCQRKEPDPGPEEQSPSQASGTSEIPPAEPQADSASNLPMARGASLPEAQVLDVVNRKRLTPYEGPTGRVQGRVTISGDPPPVFQEVLPKIPARCTAARETFRSLFREGMQRRLADVLVAVTEYEGYVPVVSDGVTVEARGCAWNSRTVALTYGQRIDVVSKDENTYIPELLGQPWPVQLVATPKGQPISVPPQKPGHYVLVDSLRLFNSADVYVLPYATFDVTGLDGTFEIDRIPPGRVKVDALLPATRATKGQEVTVVAGETVTVDIELSFDQKAYDLERAEAERKAGERGTQGSAPKQ